MFVLYAVLIGSVVGVLLGGDATRLGSFDFHWKPVIIGGLFFQAVLFAPAVAGAVGDLGPWLYVASTAAVLAAVVRNVGIPGLAMVTVGAVSNLAAIVANGGYMPASIELMSAVGRTPPPGYSNSALVLHPALQPLTDVFALPLWLPFANVFSIGDVLIGVGVAWAIVAIMEPGRLSPLRGDGARRQLSLVTRGRGTASPFAAWDSRRTVRGEEHQLLHWKSVQGKPAVRRGTQSQGSRSWRH
jgi:hypothetical protein